jgi:hypothetical protein
MIHATFTKQVINADDRQFLIPTSVEATFFNVGNDIVFLEDVKVNPGESFKVGSSGCILKNATIEIAFEGKLKKKLILIYNAPINC